MFKQFGDLRGMLEESEVRDFVSIEEILQTIHSSSELAIARLAHLLEELRRKREAQETADRT